MSLKFICPECQCQELVEVRSACGQATVIATIPKDGDLER